MQHDEIPFAKAKHVAAAAFSQLAHTVTAVDYSMYAGHNMMITDLKQAIHCIQTVFVVPENNTGSQPSPAYTTSASAATH
jgi:hypothetical protein